MVYLKFKNRYQIIVTLGVSIIFMAIVLHLERGEKREQNDFFESISHFFLAILGAVIIAAGIRFWKNARKIQSEVDDELGIERTEEEEIL
jgi:ribose/xylose/arabinose/galactoside ABC-type transport system permease subunit